MEFIAAILMLASLKSDVSPIINDKTPAWRQPPGARSTLLVKGSTMVKVKEVSNGVKCGLVFGTREVIGPPFSMGYGRRYHALCKCQCGRLAVVIVDEIKRGAGCMSCAATRHGESHTPLHGVWLGMRNRCYWEPGEYYKDYGGRGIFVCDEWRDSYETFRDWALLHGYEEGLEIDRRDNDGPYSPDNCRFITRKENCSNKRNNRFAEAFGERKTFTQWTEDNRCSVTLQGLAYRIDVLGWDVERAITQPSAKGKRVCAG